MDTLKLEFNNTISIRKLWNKINGTGNGQEEKFALFKYQKMMIYAF